MSKPQLVLKIEGMTCNSCAEHVEKALKSINGVSSVKVPGWQSGRAEVSLNADVPEGALITAVEQAGYQATVVDTPQNQPQPVTIENGEESDFDLMVIGGGSAGFAAAIRGAELGYRVGLVNSGEIGGTCVNIGCVPSKTLIRAMETYHRAGEHRFHGVQTSQGALNWAQVIAHKDKLVTELRKSKYIDVLTAYPQITYIEGYARWVNPKTIEVDGKSYTPKRVVLATGARPWIPPISGLKESGYLTSTSAMSLRALPASMIVLGGNAVGLEQAQLFARAGVAVTVVDILPRIAPFDDALISRELTACLQEEGINILTSVETKRVERKNGKINLVGKKQDEEIHLTADEILVATGRRANTTGLALDKGNVETGRRGEVIVDEYLRTSNPQVCAAGDVTGQNMFVYVAAYAGGLAAENALNGNLKPYDLRALPRVTFTDPQIAAVGLTEEEARAAGLEIEVSILPMKYVPHALAARDTRGIIKLIAHSKQQTLLGAHILAPQAGDMIQVAVLAIKYGLTMQDLRETLFPYLTSVEGLKLATLAFEKDIEKLSCCAG